MNRFGRIRSFLGLLLKRLFALVFTLLAVSVLVFFLGRLFVPGDAATVIVGSEGASEEAFQELRDRLGLNDPLHVQYVSWITGVAQGDFGVSPIHEREVTDDLGRQLPVSLELAFFGLAIAIVIGVPVGIAAAWWGGKGADLALRSVMLVSLSVPMFVFGILFVLLTALYFPEWGVTKYVHWTEDPVGNLRSILLPSLAIGLPVAGMIAQVTRAAMLEVASEQYIDTARAKGLSRARIALLHLFKNAAAPVVTVIGFQFGLLLGGVVVIEEIFSIPGLGRGLLLALSQRDFPMLMAGTMTIAAVFVGANLLVDLIYPILDPRQRGQV